MGGVDRSDQNVSFYGSLKSREKWYFPIMLHIINLSVANAWLLYKAATKTKLDHLAFKMELAEFYLNKSQVTKQFRQLHHTQSGLTMLGTLQFA